MQPDDALLNYTSKVDALVDRIDALLDHQQNSAQTQTIHHTTTGIGNWGVAAVVSCFMTYLALIIFAVWSIFQINNLTAWENVYGRDLAAMKQIIQQQQSGVKKP